MKRIVCWLVVASLPFSVLAEALKEKNAKVTLVNQHELAIAGSAWSDSRHDGCLDTLIAALLRAKIYRPD
jgi:hypothetical protein